MSGFRPYWLPLRAFLYLCFMAGVLALYAYATIKTGFGEMEDLTLSQLLREDGVIEGIEIGVVLTCVLVGLGAFRPGEPGLHRLFPLLMGIPLFRELDDIIEGLLWKDAHHLGMGLMEILLVAVLWRERRRLAKELPDFFRRPGFYYMLFGATLVLAFGQILGQRDIWKSLSPENSRLAKRFMEEGMELMGYLCILIGILEERVLAWWSRRRPSARIRPEFSP